MNGPYAPVVLVCALLALISAQQSSATRRPAGRHEIPDRRGAHQYTENQRELREELQRRWTPAGHRSVSATPRRGREGGRASHVPRRIPESGLQAHTGALLARLGGIHGRAMLYRYQHDLKHGSVQDPQFNVSFTDRDKAVDVFDEGDFHLTTGGSSACARPDHLDYDFALTDCGGCHGLRVRMDNKNATCSSSASISTGHLASKTYFSYGDFEILARTAHSSLDDHHPPSNAFTCFSAYTSQPRHNEIALCWPPSDTGVLHLGHWNGTNGDREHRTDVQLGFDASAGFHRYKFEWRHEIITFSIDGRVVHRDTGVTVPTGPMSMRIILRPNNKPSTYEGEALLTVRFAAYTPAPSSSSSSSRASWSRNTPVERMRNPLGRFKTLFRPGRGQRRLRKDLYDSTSDGSP